MPGSRPKGLVFVSYKRPDMERVEPVVDRLGECFNVWWDRHLEPGDLWEYVLHDHLRGARCVVAFWTASLSARSYMAKCDVEHAAHRGDAGSRGVQVAAQAQVGERACVRSAVGASVSW